MYFSSTRKSTIKEMINALDRYLIEGVKQNKDFLSNILQNKNFEKCNYSTSFISENYKDGYNPSDINLDDKHKIHAVAVFVNYKYLLRAASISNQLKGFNKTVGMNWQVIDNGKNINARISFNNFNKSYDIYVGNKYTNLKVIGILDTLISAIIDNNLSYFRDQEMD